MSEPKHILTLRGTLQRTVPGAFALILALWFFDYLVPNPIESYCLMKYGVTAQAEILDVYEDFQEEDAGPGYMYGLVKYKFMTKEKESIVATTRKLPGGLPEGWLDEKTRPAQIAIEYCPTRPKWNRIESGDTETFLNWFWSRAVLGVFLLTLFLTPGVGLLKNGISEIRAALIAPEEARRDNLTPTEQHDNQVWLWGWILGLVSLAVFYRIGGRAPIPLIVSLLTVSAIAVHYFRLRIAKPRE